MNICKFITVAPGLPRDDEGFLDMEPTSAITEGVLKWIVVQLMDNGKRCGIELSPRDYVNLCDCQKFADLLIGQDLDNKTHAVAVITSHGGRVVKIRGLSLQSARESTPPVPCQVKDLFGQ